MSDDSAPSADAQPPADGTDLAKSFLSRAKSAARNSPSGSSKRTRSGGGSAGSRRGGRFAPGAGWSGPDQDDRDPQAIGMVVDKMTTENGWDDEIAVHGVIARWAEIVGIDVAAHVTPAQYENGVLTVHAESSAWATQMRMLAAQIVKRMNEEIGDGSVTRLEVHGPQTRDWRKGPRRVPGRGPRDTYG